MNVAKQQMMLESIKDIACIGRMELFPEQKRKNNGWDSEGSPGTSKSE